MEFINNKLVCNNTQVYREIEHEGIIILWLWADLNNNILQVCVDKYAPDDIIEQAYEKVAYDYGYTIGDLISLTK